jgi:hypothetical protein
MHSKRESVLQLEAAHGGESRQKVSQHHTFYGEDAQPFFDSLSRRHGGGHQRSCPSFQGFFQSRELSKCPALFGFFRHNTPKNTHTAQYDVPALSPHYTARPSQLIPTQAAKATSACANLLRSLSKASLV